MNKHKLSGIWHRYGKVTLLGLIAVFLISGAVSIYALRANNLKMIQLRQAVYTADEQGGDIATALNNLRQFVFDHMNTNLSAGSTSNEPPIQLVNTFNRDVAAARAKLSAQGSSDQVYTAAQGQCEQSSVPLASKAQCIEDYITAHGNGIAQLNLPPKGDYTFDFVGPFWSPDLAGWSLVATFIFGLLLISRLITGLIIKRYLAS
jgi:hypothetical protein